MPLDLDLQELRRRVAAEPESAGHWFALATGLARAGARADAVEAVWRARALGAEKEACARLRETLGARPSPWTHISADSEHTFCAPVKGPRRGEIVARESGAREGGAREGGARETASLLSGRPRAPHVVVDEDGSVVASHGGEVVRLDRRLARAKVVRLADAGTRLVPTIAPSSVVFASGVLYLASGAARTRLFSGEEKPRGVELPGMPWEHASAAVVGSRAGSRVVLGWFDVPEMKFKVDVFDEALVRQSGFELLCERWSSWAAGESGLAIVLETWIRFMGLDGSVRFSRNCAARIDGLALLNGRVVWSELRESSRTESTRWVQKLDETGSFVWGKNVEGDVAPGKLAVSPEGTIHVASGDGLVRFTSDGRELARGPASVVDSGIVVDREGVAFVATVENGRTGLVAIAPDGARVFFVPEELDPVAIDAFGRVLAISRDNAIVAIE